MAIYDRFQSTAKALLGKFEQGEVKLIKITTSGPDYDPTITETPYIQTGAVKGVSAKYVDMQTEGGAMINAADLEVLVPGGGQVPTTSDKYDIDGKRHEILQVEPIPAAGTTAVYRVIVKG